MLRKLAQSDIKKVSELHESTLPGFISELGYDFLNRFYTVSMDVPSMKTLVYGKKGNVQGFTSLAEEPSGILKEIISKDIPGFGYFFAQHYLRNPGHLKKSFQTLTYPGFKGSEPELLTISVAERHRGKGLGKTLFLSVAEELKGRGYKKFKVSAYDRLKANSFYTYVGCKKVKSFDFLGEKMNYYEYVIS